MIYKYYPVNEKFLQCLQEQKLWFSKPTEFNDPFDCNMQILNEFPDFKERLHRLEPNLQQKITEVFENFGICCFSEESDNMHLWALYADGFKGLVLGFDETGFNDYFTKLFSAKCILEPVNYSKKPLDLDNGEIQEDNEVITPVRAFFLNEKRFDKLLECLITQKKESPWAIEKEKRLIINTLARKNGAKRYEDIENKGYFVPWKPDSLKTIIFGYRMSDIDKNRLEKIITDNNISANIQQAELNFKTWEIKIEPK